MVSQYSEIQSVELTWLPVDILSVIASFVRTRELGSYAMVCHDTSEAVLIADDVWNRLLLLDACSTLEVDNKTLAVERFKNGVDLQHHHSTASATLLALYRRRCQHHPTALPHTNDGKPIDLLYHGLSPINSQVVTVVKRKTPLTETDHPRRRYGPCKPPTDEDYDGSKEGDQLLHTVVQNTNPLLRAKSYDSMPLDVELLRGVYAYGLEKPSLIQQLLIPTALYLPIHMGEATPPAKLALNKNRRNFYLADRAGTGKSMGSMIIMLQRVLMEERYGPKRRAGSSSVQGLFLLPTRELAIQFEHIVGQLGSYLGWSSSTTAPTSVQHADYTGSNAAQEERKPIPFCLGLFGGVQIKPQLFALASYRVKIVAATPGRLIDMVHRLRQAPPASLATTTDGNTSVFSLLSNVHTVIMEEMVRFFEMGFGEQLWELQEALFEDRRSMAPLKSTPTREERIDSSYLPPPPPPPMFIFSCYTRLESQPRAIREFMLCASAQERGCDGGLVYLEHPSLLMSSAKPEAATITRELEFSQHFYVELEATSPTELHSIKVDAMADLLCEIEAHAVPPVVVITVNRDKHDRERSSSLAAATASASRAQAVSTSFPQALAQDICNALDSMNARIHQPPHDPTTAVEESEGRKAEDEEQDQPRLSTLVSFIDIDAMPIEELSKETKKFCAGTTRFVVANCTIREAIFKTQEHDRTTDGGSDVRYHHDFTSLRNNERFNDAPIHIDFELATSGKEYLARHGRVARSKSRKLTVISLASCGAEHNNHMGSAPGSRRRLLRKHTADHPEDWCSDGDECFSFEFEVNKRQHERHVPTDHRTTTHAVQQDEVFATVVDTFPNHANNDNDCTTNSTITTPSSSTSCGGGKGPAIVDEVRCLQFLRGVLEVPIEELPMLDQLEF